MGKKSFRNVVVLGALAGLGVAAYKKLETVKAMYKNVYALKGEHMTYDDLFEGETLAGFCSGFDIDLRDADFSEEEVYLDLYGFCSGFNIRIPSNCEVILEGSNRMSGIELSQDEEEEKSKTLFINYDLMCSGLRITDAETVMVGNDVPGEGVEKDMEEEIEIKVKTSYNEEKDE